MFPGQGSQKTGMGESGSEVNLWEAYAEEVELANQTLGYDSKEICLNPENASKLNQTQFTQPLLFLVNHLSFLEAKKNASKDNPEEDFFAMAMGHSLGEYNALLTTEVIDLSDGIKIVQERARLMGNIGKTDEEGKEKGGMAAVLGLEDEKVEEIIKDNPDIEIANYNSKGQIVVSGKLEALKIAESEFKAGGAKRFILLPVSGAFHSSNMKQAANQFKEFLGRFEFNSPKKKVIANITAGYYPSDPAAIKDYLYQQIFSPVKWKQSILFLRKEMGENLELQEIGPGNVLTNLAKRI